MRYHTIFIFLIVIQIFSDSTANSARAETEQPAQEETSDRHEKKNDQQIFASKAGKLPTYIKADTLSLKAEEREFTYSGNVEVLQGDMTLTADFLEGKYGETNQIETLTARSNVVIVKGDALRATSQKAVYEAATETVLLTDNPELQREGSVLTADLIKLFLDEDRSSAEGSVRVKLVQNEETKKGKKKNKKKPVS